MEICEYAHRSQKRVNGEDYANHPYRCLDSYRQLIGINVDGEGNFDEDLLANLNIPYNGVQEVCLLHDVVEDTELSFEDVRDIYIECGFERYFNLYIADALQRITHIKEMSYDEYIMICTKNPISAIVKMMDLQDNLNVLSLVEFNEENFKRTKNYLNYIYVINKLYRFIENCYLYRSVVK